MGSDAPVELLVATLSDKGSYEHMVSRLVTLDQGGAIELLSLARLDKDASGEVTFERVSYPEQPHEGELSKLEGTAAGLLAGHVTEVAVDGEEIEALGHELPSGRSAVLALVEHESVERIRQEFDRAIAEVWRFTLKVDPLDVADAGS